MTTIATMKGGLKQSIRNHIASLVFGLAPVRDMMADALTEVSIGYPDSPLSMHGASVNGGPHAGQRAPIREAKCRWARATRRVSPSSRSGTKEPRDYWRDIHTSSNQTSASHSKQEDFGWFDPTDISPWRPLRGTGIEFPHSSTSWQRIDETCWGN